MAIIRMPTGVFLKEKPKAAWVMLVAFILVILKAPAKMAFMLEPNLQTRSLTLCLIRLISPSIKRLQYLAVFMTDVQPWWMACLPVEHLDFIWKAQVIL